MKRRKILRNVTCILIFLIIQNYLIKYVDLEKNRYWFFVGFLGINVFNYVMYVIRKYLGLFCVLISRFLSEVYWFIDGVIMSILLVCFYDVFRFSDN